MQIFDVIILFELRTIQQKTVKPTYLCPLGARKLAEGKEIHKVNNPGRPIVSACSCPTEHISEYLDAVLQPLVQSLPTYIKDSTHALNLIEDINQTPNFKPKYLFTMDVTSLYTCIPPLMD